MKGFKCIGLLTVFLIGTLTSGMLSTTAYAVSDYDDWIKLTTELKVQDGDENDLVHLENDGIRLSEACSSTALEDFDNAVASDDGKWAMIQTQTGEFYYTVDYVWTTNPDASAVFHDLPAGNITVPYQSKISLYGDDSDLHCDYTTTDGNFGIAFAPEAPSDTVKIYLSTYPITYPPDYAGPEIPDSIVPSQEYNPALHYNVAGRDLQAFYNHNIPYPNDALINLHWQLWRTDGDESKVADKNYDSYAPFNVKNLQNGTYKILLDFTIKPPGTLPDDITVHQTVQNLVIDGSSFEGNNTDNDCEDGVCAAPSPYEDCSTYGTDIIGGFGCQLRNFGVWLKVLFQSLFIPSESDLSSFYNGVNHYFTEKLGLLTYPYAWFANLLTALNTADVNCAEPSISGIPGAQYNGTFFGAHFYLNPCSAQTNFPKLYNIGVFIVRAMFVFGMIYAVQRKLLVIINNHDKRGDEALYR